MNKNKRLVTAIVATVTVLVLASSCSKPTNHEPIITSLEAEAGSTTFSDSVQVVCNASDPDGDELSYIWWASGGELNGDGTTVTWTAPASEGSYNVTVKVIDGHDGEATDYVAITVIPNKAPAIAGLTADADWTTPSGRVGVTCNASDPDGDELSYEWTATAGSISGTGGAVNWTAPQQLGKYNITVVVLDGYGGSATETLSVNVVTGQPPIIETLLVTAEHCYLKAYPGGYYVGKEQKYDIECIVADTGMELFYEWSCTRGMFSGEGSAITWTAPNESVDVVVEVTVSDITGSIASENIILTVVTCSPCFFGC